MKKPALPYLEVRRKGTSAYWYFRRGKGPTVRLPDPDAPGFLAAYDEAKKERRRETGKTTIAALIRSYSDSPRWEDLAPRTRADYRKVLIHIEASAGMHDVTVITRPAVLTARDNNRHRARFANYLVQLYSVLCEHAVDIGWLPRNPIRGTKLLKLKGDGYPPWPAKAIDAYRAAATGRAALICDLCLGTGQRIGDVLKMRWSDIEAGGINVRQNKTAATVWLPFTPRLARALSAAPRDGLTIIAGEHGKSVSYRAASASVMAARRSSGTTAWSIHGWRSNAASELYEAGCTDAQVQAITGHKSAVQARKYGRGARQKLLAAEAQGHRERTGGEQ